MGSGLNIFFAQKPGHDFCQSVAGGPGGGDEIAAAEPAYTVGVVGLIVSERYDQLGYARTQCPGEGTDAAMVGKHGRLGQ